MTKREIIDYLAKKTGLTKKDVSAVLDEFNLLIYKKAKKSFTIPGIGKIYAVRRKARKGRNPQTGETIRIPAKKVLKFRISETCKKAVLGK